MKSQVRPFFSNEFNVVLNPKDDDDDEDDNVEEEEDSLELVGLPEIEEPTQTQEQNSEQLNSYKGTKDEFSRDIPVVE